MDFTKFSPQTLRDAIELEMQRNPNAKLAAGIALRNLNKDPNYYGMQKGFKFSKYIQKVPDGKGGFRYIYTKKQLREYKKEQEQLKEKAQRIGGMNFDNLTVDQIREKLKCDFKFKDINADGVLTADEVEYHTRCIIAGVSDLSDILNLPVQQITANGKLGLFFDNKEVRYNGNDKIINLMQNQNSLAHEWGHFMDNILSGDDIGELSLLSSEMDEQRYKRIARRIADLSNKTFRSQVLSEDKPLADKILKDSYLTHPAEIFARSFEAYIADKITAAKRKNIYLVSPKKTIESYGQLLYPQGEARKRLNRLFDEFFDEIRMNNELQKAISRYQNQGGLMQKAQQYKYVKRVPKPGGGYTYTYPEDKLKPGTSAPQPEKKGFLSGIISFFGSKDSQQAREKVKQIFESTPQIKNNFQSMPVYADYLNEYLLNKDRWDEKIKTVPSPKKDKKPTEKKSGPKREKKERGSITEDGKRIYKISLMKIVAESVGGLKKDESEGKKEYSLKDYEEAMDYVGAQRTIDKLNITRKEVIELAKKIPRPNPVISLPGREIKRELSPREEVNTALVYYSIKNRIENPTFEMVEDDFESIKKRNEQPWVKIDSFNEYPIEIHESMKDYSKMLKDYSKKDKRMMNPFADATKFMNKRDPEALKKITSIKQLGEEMKNGVSDPFRDSDRISKKANELYLKEVKKRIDFMVEEIPSNDLKEIGTKDLKKEFKKNIEQYSLRVEIALSNFMLKIKRKNLNELKKEFRLSHDNYREMFTEMTGVDLGSTQASTDEALKEFVKNRDNPKQKTKPELKKKQSTSEIPKQAMSAQKEYDNAVKQKDTMQKDFEGITDHTITDSGKIKDEDGDISYNSLSEYFEDQYTIPSSMKPEDKDWLEKVKNHFKNDSFFDEKTLKELEKIKTSYYDYLKYVERLKKLKDSEALMGPKLFKGRLFKKGNKYFRMLKKPGI